MKGGEIFKAGDRVTVKSDKNNSHRYYESIIEGIIQEIDKIPYHFNYLENKISDSDNLYTVYSHNGKYLGLFLDYELKHSIKPFRHELGIMKKLSLIAQRLLDKDLWALVKAGILNEELAVEDTDFVLSFFVTEYKKELAAEARKLLKSKKKKCEDDEEE